MAKIRIKFRTPAAAGQPGDLYFHISHSGVARLADAGCRIMPDEWDVRGRRVRVDDDSSRAEELKDICRCLSVYKERLAAICGRLDKSGMEYDAGDIADEFLKYRRECSLFGYMARLADRKKQCGSMRTAETYFSALSSFRTFRSGRDIMLDCITAEVMEEYEAWLAGRGLIPNTVGFYTRILRAVYNSAVAEGLVEDRHPFRKVYTGVDKTVKRAVPMSVIRRMMSLNLAAMPALDYARDMFIMSFCLRGMSFVDMSYLKKSDLRDGNIVYRRRKTGQRLTIAWEGQMQAILDKYPPNPTEYLLPVITSATADTRKAYRSRSSAINRNLKKVAAMLGVAAPLTLYVARHSWASAAKTLGIPLRVISEGMGHDSETTTQIYLAQLETSVVDRANSVILSSLADS